MARQQGYLIKKSRRTISSDNCGDLMLVDLRTNAAILGSRYDATPEDVLEFFDGEQKKNKNAELRCRFVGALLCRL